MAPKINLDDYYTAKQAAARLTENSGHTIDADYPRSLARYKKVASVQMGNAKLYLKKDIDAYQVKDRPGPHNITPGQLVKNKRSGRPGGRPRKQQAEKEQL